MTEVIDALRAAETEYYPSEEVCDALSEVVMVPIIGPLAVGKSTCMGRIITIDPKSFGRVQSFTTRPMREGEPEHEYRWHDGSPEGLADILEAVEEGELVQYAIHPTTDVVYGSDLSDFSRPYNMLDTLPLAVAPLRRLPFRDMTEITLVMLPRQWQLGLGFRSSQVGGEEMKKRLEEGRRSLIWSLAQGGDMKWVNNVYNQIGKTAQEVRGLALGEREPDPRSRDVGEQLLKYITGLLDE